MQNKTTTAKALHMRPNGVLSQWGFVQLLAHVVRIQRMLHAISGSGKLLVGRTTIV